MNDVDVDRALECLAEARWSKQVPRSRFYTALVQETRRRNLRRILFAAPLILAVGACATYGVMRRVHVFSTRVEITLDGEPAGVRSVPVEVIDGVVQPMRLDVGEHGKVELRLDIPDDVDPMESLTLRARRACSSRRSSRPSPRAIERRAVARRVFHNAEGELHAVGERFRQPDLARRLRRTAEVGSSEFYTGEWARRFVELVRAEGGKLSREDLARYRPIWQEPVVVRYRGTHVYGLPAPNRGGESTVMALNLATELGLYGDAAGDLSCEALLALASIERAFGPSSELAKRDSRPGLRALAERRSERAPSLLGAGSIRRLLAEPRGVRARARLSARDDGALLRVGDRILGGRRARSRGGNDPRGLPAAYGRVGLWSLGGGIGSKDGVAALCFDDLVIQ